MVQNESVLLSFQINLIFVLTWTIFLLVSFWKKSALFPFGKSMAARAGQLSRKMALVPRGQRIRFGMEHGKNRFIIHFLYAN
jgi:hypothetical protein